MTGLNKDWQEADQSGGYYNQEKIEIVFDSNGEPLTDESILEDAEYRRLQSDSEARDLQKLNY